MNTIWSEYWPIATLFMGFALGYLRMNYGIGSSRGWRWISTLLFWFSLGVLVPDVWHPSLWWSAPVLSIGLAVVVLSFQDIKDWLVRLEQNTRRRREYRRKRRW